MVRRIRAAELFLTLSSALWSAAAFAQSDAPQMTLTVAAGRPLDILLDQRVVIKTVGQPVTGTLVQPLYAYDRVVVPAGTRVIGHVEALDPPSKFVRVRAMLSGDLTPPRHVVLKFDTFEIASGVTISLESIVKGEISRPTRSNAPPSNADAADTNVVGRTRRQATDRARAAIADAKRRGRDVLAEFRAPGKGARIKDGILQRLPYHQQLIAAGTGYHAELTAPLAFGTVTPSVRASADVRPAPSSVLNARLLTSLDSSKTPRGTPIQAVVTQPVFSAEHELIVPEGTVLDGEVTFTKPARWFHRNGQLRFLFERIHRDARTTAPLLASLDSVEASSDDHVAIDEEGGVTMKESKTRFIAPALAVLALRGGLDHEDHLDPDGDGHIIHSSNSGALGAGGFFGLGILGIGLSQISRPVGIALSVVGAGRTLYSNVFGRGREMKFAADTPIQLQLAPGPAAAAR